MWFRHDRCGRVSNYTGTDSDECAFQAMTIGHGLAVLVAQDAEDSEKLRFVIFELDEDNQWRVADSWIWTASLFSAITVDTINGAFVIGSPPSVSGLAQNESGTFPAIRIYEKIENSWTRVFTRNTSDCEYGAGRVLAIHKDHVYYTDDIYHGCGSSVAQRCHNRITILTRAESGDWSRDGYLWTGNNRDRGIRRIFADSNYIAIETGDNVNPTSPYRISLMEPDVDSVIGNTYPYSDSTICIGWGYQDLVLPQLEGVEQVRLLGVYGDTIAVGVDSSARPETSVYFYQNRDDRSWERVADFEYDGTPLRFKGDRVLLVKSGLVRCSG